MIMRISGLLFLLLLLLPCASGAQESFADRKKKAKEYFYNARYQEALNTLQLAQRNNMEDKETKFLMAVSYYLLNRLGESEEILREQIDQKSPFPESWLYLARIYHDQNDFLKASEYYKAYLKTLAADDPNRQLVRDAIRRCSNGIQWQFRPPLALVENLGPGINSVHDEFGPIMSPNATDRLYFSSSRPGCAGGLRNKEGLPDELFGRYTSDIFYARFISGQWKDPVNLSYLINSPKHEVVLDFNPNGRSMYFFKGNALTSGQIFVDTFSSGTKALISEPFFSPIDAIAGISAPHFVNDTFVIFPSNRPGGYGGLDLYRAVFSKGRWSVPENLGPDINTPYDETTPFLARDGKTLYFSSNNPQWSIGAFDVVKSVFNTSANRWTSPYNLGLPVNSAEDETHFRLARDGYTAYFASSRKDGMGERDIYAAYFFDFLPEMSIAAETLRPSGPEIAIRGSVAPLKLHPVFFDSEQEPLAPNSAQQLEALAIFLKQNPSSEILLTGYSQIEMAVSSRIFSGATAALRVAEFLLEKGAPAKSIRIRGALHSEMNTALKGVDCRILNTPNKEFQAEYGTPIGQNTRLAQAADALTYRLQIASTEGIYRGPLLAQLESPITEMQQLPKGPYTYYVGQFATFAEALTARSRYGGAGASGILIQPFVNDRLLTSQELQTLTSQFPDLTNYLQFIQK